MGIIGNWLASKAGDAGSWVGGKIGGAFGNSNVGSRIGRGVGEIASPFIQEFVPFEKGGKVQMMKVIKDRKTGVVVKMVPVKSKKSSPKKTGMKKTGMKKKSNK